MLADIAHLRRGGLAVSAGIGLPASIGPRAYIAFSWTKVCSCCGFTFPWEEQMSVSRTVKGGAILAVVAGLLLGAPVLSHAETGLVRMKVSKAGFIVGVGGGSGTLNFKGRNYPFRVGGISAGTIGVASADLRGRAYNMRSPGDIAGTYAAAGAGVAVAGGAKGARLQNANGVVLELSGPQIGFEASLGLAGLTISMP
jgi:hypothetical protein